MITTFVREYMPGSPDVFELFRQSFIRAGISLWNEISTSRYLNEEFSSYARIIENVWDYDEGIDSGFGKTELGHSYITLRSFLTVFEAKSNINQLRKIRCESAIELIGEYMLDDETILEIESLIQEKLIFGNIGDLTSNFNEINNIWEKIDGIDLPRRVDYLDRFPLLPDEQGPNALWFGTNRKMLAEDDSDVVIGFANERDLKGQIHYGSCIVNVDPINAGGWGLSINSNENLKNVKIIRSTNDQEKFVSLLKTKFSTEDNNGILLYLHGFNTSFEAAAITAAKIRDSLNWQGISAFYSWPSRAKRLSYLPDRDEVEASEKQIAEFLKMMIDVAKDQNKKLHIIAHSMGNRAFMRALQALPNQYFVDKTKPFGQVILAAADIAPDLFRHIVETHQNISDRTTMYISDFDLAIWLSKTFVWRIQRVGQMPATVVQGVDTIDVSNLETVGSWVKDIGHGYVTENINMQRDLKALLNNSYTRDWLIDMTVNGQTYWAFKHPDPLTGFA